MSQLKTATSRHPPRPTTPVDQTGAPGTAERTSPSPSPESPEPLHPLERTAAPGLPSVHSLWWERLPADERRHTRACVEANDVDAWMLDIFRRSGPVGPYGVRWMRDAATFLPGSFVDFVRGVPADPAGC